MMSFLKQRWLLVLLFVAVPTAAALPFILIHKGEVRWFAIGAAAISGPWMALMFIVIFSGAVSPLVGLQAEAWTAEELRLMCRKGWHLVNGLQLRGDFDIDHVAFGPPGVFVVETKWGTEPWFDEANRQRFLRDRLNKAVTQAKNNCHDIAAQFADSLAGAPVKGVCVLWSAEEPPSGDTSSRDVDGVAVVSGPAFGAWLRTLHGVELDPAHLESIWRAVEDHAAKRDRNDAKRGVGYRATMAQLAWQWLLAPFVGAVLAAYITIACSRLLEVPIALCAILALAGLGWIARREPRLRTAATAWTATAGCLFALFLALEVVAALK